MLWIGGLALTAAGVLLVAVGLSEDFPSMALGGYFLGAVAGILLTVAMIGSGVKIGVKAARDN